MMSEKTKLFGDNATCRNSTASSDPARQKHLGRSVSNISQDLWERHRHDIVFNGNLDKFSVPPLLQQHVGTGGKILAEASPRDLFWGIGFRAEDKRVSALRYGRDNTFWVTSS